MRKLITFTIFFMLIVPVSASEKLDAKKIFKQKCSLCHAVDKKKLGPAVKSMSRDAAVLREAITKGRKPMPAYEKKLTKEEIGALVGYLMANQ